MWGGLFGWSGCLLGALFRLDRGEDEFGLLVLFGLFEWREGFLVCRGAPTSLELFVQTIHDGTTSGSVSRGAGLSFSSLCRASGLRPWLSAALAALGTSRSGVGLSASFGRGLFGGGGLRFDDGDEEGGFEAIGFGR